MNKKKNPNKPKKFVDELLDKQLKEQPIYSQADFDAIKADRDNWQYRYNTLAALVKIPYEYILPHP